MAHFIFVSTIGDIIYADTKDEPGLDGADHMEALRRVDGNIGETDLEYQEVPQDDPEASLHVYRAEGEVRTVERDATYVTSIKVSPPSPKP